ncbi:MAG: helix-turn-helix domain-containing protein [Chthoniobacterales bacterium]
MNTMTQPLSLGDMLTEAREAKGVSLEQAARETKIRASQLRDMEKNNITHFAHPSYARLFLRDYAKYLGLSRAVVEEYLPETGECSSDGMEYLEGYANEERLGASLRHQAPARRSSPLAAFGGVVLAILLLVGGLYVWNVWRDVGRSSTAKHNAPVTNEVAKNGAKPVNEETGVDDAKPVAPPAETDNKTSTTPAASEQKAPDLAQSAGSEKEVSDEASASGPLAATTSASRKTH